MYATVFSPGEKARGFVALSLGFLCLCILIDAALSLWLGHSFIYCHGMPWVIWLRTLGMWAGFAITGYAFFCDRRRMVQGLFWLGLSYSLPFAADTLIFYGHACFGPKIEPKANPASPIAQVVQPPPPVVPAPAMPPVVQQAKPKYVIPAPVQIPAPPETNPKYAMGPYDKMPSPKPDVQPEESYWLSQAASLMQMEPDTLVAWMRAGRVKFWNRAGGPTTINGLTEIWGRDIIKFMDQYCADKDAPPYWRCHSLTDAVAAPPVTHSSEPVAHKWEEFDGTNPYSVEQAARLLRMKPKTLIAHMNKRELPFKDLAGWDTTADKGLIMGDDLEDFETKYCKPLPTYPASRCKGLH